MANEKYPIAKADLSSARRKSKGKTKRKFIICPQCKKDYSVGVKAAYKLGLLEGENRLQITINCIRKTNRHLYDELLRLDRVQPLDSYCVKMSLKYTEVLIKCLLKNKLKWHANKLHELIKSQIHQP